MAWNSNRIVRSLFWIPAVPERGWVPMTMILVIRLSRRGQEWRCLQVVLGCVLQCLHGPWGSIEQCSCEWFPGSTKSPFLDLSRDARVPSQVSGTQRTLHCGSFHIYWFIHLFIALVWVESTVLGYSAPGEFCHHEAQGSFPFLSSRWEWQTEVVSEMPIWKLP